MHELRRKLPSIGQSPPGAALWLRKLVDGRAVVTLVIDGATSIDAQHRFLTGRTEVRHDGERGPSAKRKQRRRKSERQREGQLGP